MLCTDAFAFNNNTHPSFQTYSENWKAEEPQEGHLHFIMIALKSQEPVFTNHKLPAPNNTKYHQPRIKSSQQRGKELLRLPYQEHKADDLIL